MIDLNATDITTLTERIKKLKAGQSLQTKDGLKMRKRLHPGYDMGIGVGGWGAKRANTALEAARMLLEDSAKRMHSDSLGGETRYETLEAALQAASLDDHIPETTAQPEEDGPSFSAIKNVVQNAGLRNYRNRAQKARLALARGDAKEALHHLQAIENHANTYGRMQDADRARSAARVIQDNHRIPGLAPEPEKLGITTRVIDGEWYLYSNGQRLPGGPYSDQEAKSRAGFMARERMRDQSVESIDNEITGVPNVVRRGDTEAA